MEPLNYSGAFDNIQSPVQAFTQGLQGAQMVLQNQMAQMQMQRSLAMQKALMQIGQNPTPQDVAQLSVMFPEMSEQFKRSFDMLTPVQQQNKINATLPIYAAVQNGRYDTAAQMLHDQATASENSGNAQQAAQQRAMAQMVLDHPETANTTMGLLLSSAMGPDKFTEAFKGIGDQQRASQLQPAALQKAQGEGLESQAKGLVAAQTVPQQVQKAGLENQNLNSQIANRANQLALDRDKLTSDFQLKLMELKRKPGAVDLSSGAESLVNEAVQNATLGRQSANQLNDLANQIETADPRALGAGVGEWLAGVTGQQDYVSSLRKEYNRIMTSQSIQSLKGVGRITDREMSAAMSGFPSSTANPQQMTMFLRGMAKIQQYNSAVDDAKSEWVSTVGTLGKTQRDIDVQGARVPAGTTFQDFINKKIKIPGASTQPAPAAAGAKERLLQTYGGAAPAPTQAVPAAPAQAPAQTQPAFPMIPMYPAAY